jgi:pSer/pThr/pTyr-binding forkhead associated (FHA) protein
VLRLDGVAIVLTDLGSQNGSFLNDRPTDSAQVRDGDLLTFGRTRLVVSGLRTLTEARRPAAGAAGTL